MKKPLILLILHFLVGAAGLYGEHFVSFIIPCYNCENTVEESIASIYEQQLALPFEVICTNDGSTDGTAAVLSRCEKKYHHFFVYSHERNRGGGAARNTCVQHSQGDLIFCLDSDNVLAPHSIQPLIDLMDQTQADVVAFEELRLFRDEKEATGRYILSGIDHFYDLTNWLAAPCSDPSMGGNYLYTRKSYDRAGGYWEDLSAVDTHSFGFKLLATGSVIRVLPGSFYWHRLDDNSYYIRENRKNTNNANLVKALYRISEIFSEETRQEFLEDIDPETVYHIFYDQQPNQFELAESKILQSLFRGYRFRQEKNYKRAAFEFGAAISEGCQSEKIQQLFLDMLNLIKGAL